MFITGFFLNITFIFQLLFIPENTPGAKTTRHTVLPKV